jgi:hypothetical protein
MILPIVTGLTIAYKTKLASSRCSGNGIFEMKNYPFRRVGAPIFWVLLLILGHDVFAQPVNELKLMQPRQGYALYLTERGNYYYFDFAHAKREPGKQDAVMLERHKYHKTNYTFNGSAISAGDTIQYDSVVTTSAHSRYIFWNGNIAYAGTEFFYPSNTNYHGLVFSLMDTNMNVLIPRRRLKEVLYGGVWTNVTIAGMSTLGSRLAIFYSQVDTGKGPYKVRTCGILLDEDGTILKDTTVVNYDFRADRSMPYPGNRCMLSGGTEHVLLDSNLVVVDTFKDKPLHMPSGPYRGYFGDGGHEIALPSGTLIKGGEYTILQGPGGGRPTALSRLTAATRYSSDTTLLIFNGPYDPAGGGNYYHNLQYNDFDKRVYYVNSTRQPSPYYCLDTLNHLQVICTDTLLRPLWRKFITLGSNVCATAQWVAASDGRGGIGVMGYQYDIRFPMLDTAHSGCFLFHLDSAGSVSVNGGLSPVVRDRIRIYPNPATDAFVIDDVLGGLKTYVLYDMSGRQVNSKTVSGKLAKVALDGLAMGPYVLRVMLSDGSAISQTVMKQ